PPKKKGNPIITRYPPPPGYRGPAQPQAPFGTNQFSNQYQPPQSVYPQAVPTPPSYPQQGYGAPSTHQGYPPTGYGQQQPPQPPPTYPQGQNYQWPQQSYQQNPGYSQQPHNFSSGQEYAPSQPPGGYPGYPPQTTPAEPNQQTYGRPPGWPPQSGQILYPLNSQHNSSSGPPMHSQSMSDPNATPTPATANLVASQPPQPPNQPPSTVSENNSNLKPQLFLAWDDWDFDFDGAIWPKSNEPVDPNLSLGVIIWHPAKQMTRALPSTFAEAEEQSMKPTPEKLENGESVSMYFMAENSHEAFLDVRQTDEWERIQDDPVFVVFTDEETQHKLVSLEDCIAQRDRLEEPTEDTKQDEDQEMRDAAWDIMDNLEQALSNSKPTELRQEAVASPRKTQEDILAMLGVTGTPKPLSGQPMPSPTSAPHEKLPISHPEKIAFAPITKLPNPHPPAQRAQSFGGHRDPGHGPPPPRGYSSMSSSSNSRPPPPPPPPEEQRYDPWNTPQQNGHGYHGSRGSPALSEGSNRTMAGSDFDSEKPGIRAEQDLPAVPKLQRSDSSFARKRSYEDTDQEGEKLHQQDDQTKRKRRLQVDAAYR
ncbi:hypothetical protein BKA66DRAFT_407481, partial [Pyrenochaeta sp. MPI-SDFR-AT-0127]